MSNSLDVSEARAHVAEATTVVDCFGGAGVDCFGGAGVDCFGGAGAFLGKGFTCESAGTGGAAFEAGASAMTVVGSESTVEPTSLPAVRATLFATSLLALPATLCPPTDTFRLAPSERAVHVRDTSETEHSVPGRCSSFSALNGHHCDAARPKCLGVRVFCALLCAVACIALSAVCLCCV